MLVSMRRRRLLRIAQKILRNREGLPRGPHPLPIEMARVAQWFHAASDTTRLAILQFLSPRERCVNELQQVLDAPQSSISFHLRVLRESGLVRERREGRWKYYSLRGETLKDMMAFTQVVSPGKHAGTCALSCCQ
jgi:ArsR family transcriptional regulator